MNASGLMKRAAQLKTTSGGLNTMAIQKTAPMTQPVAGSWEFCKALFVCTDDSRRT